MTGIMAGQFAIAIIMIALSGSAFAGDLEDGDAVLNRDDVFLTAITKAAEQGDVEAQFHLGKMYSKGDRVPRDYEQAAYWYKKAAEQGNVIAANRVAAMYIYGIGVLKNYQQAAYWNTKAAEQGNMWAQAIVAQMYADGQGVPRDYVQAYAWWSLAAAQGDKNARRNLDLLEKEITREQVADAQRLAREWKPR